MSTIFSIYENLIVFIMSIEFNPFPAFLSGSIKIRLSGTNQDNLIFGAASGLDSIKVHFGISSLFRFDGEQATIRQKNICASRVILVLFDHNQIRMGFEVGESRFKRFVFRVKRLGSVHANFISNSGHFNLRSFI